MIDDIEGKYIKDDQIIIMTGKDHVEIKVLLLRDNIFVYSLMNTRHIEKKWSLFSEKIAL